jgi:hypothetical protein
MRSGLGKGKYTETPVKTDFGYHVILLEDSRPLTPPPFDQIKPQIAQRLQQEQTAEIRRRTAQQGQGRLGPEAATAQALHRAAPVALPDAIRQWFQLCAIPGWPGSQPGRVVCRDDSQSC